MPDCDDEDRGVYPGAATGLGCDKPVNVLTCALRGYCGKLQTMGMRKLDCTAQPTGCPSAACDKDGDGVVDIAKKNNPTCDPGGARNPIYDCDDTKPTIFFGAPEKCGDGIDQDCDGKDLPCMGLMDADGDGYYASNTANKDFNDCDDLDPNTHPWATEVCDGKDNNCDGLVDENNPDATGMSMGTLNGTGKVIDCTDSGVGACAGPKQGGKQLGHCVCSASPVGTHHFDGGRIACPTEPADHMKAGSASHCYFAVQPATEVCNGWDDNCNGVPDIDAKDIDHTMKSEVTDCAGPALDANSTICCPQMAMPANMCIDPRSPTQIDNCGGCGQLSPKYICSRSHITPACAPLMNGVGVCAGVCNNGFADCNGDKQPDGCETSTFSVTNCGPGGRRGTGAARRRAAERVLDGERHAFVRGGLVHDRVQCRLRQLRLDRRQHRRELQWLRDQHGQ